MNFNQIEHLEEFKKELKTLLKKFPSLTEDLKTFEKTALTLFHKHNVDNKGIEPLTGTKIEYPKIFKVTKFACKSLKGRGVKSGIRIIYAYFPEEDRIEYIEIYFKADQENEDKDRIKNIYKSSSFKTNATLLK